MHHYTDGPSPLPFTPGILCLDRGQSLEECAAVAWLLEAWLTPGPPAEQDSPPPSCLDRGGLHAAE